MNNFGPCRKGETTDNSCRLERDKENRKSQRPLGREYVLAGYSIAMIEPSAEAHGQGRSEGYPRIEPRPSKSWIGLAIDRAAPVKDRQA